MSGLRCLDRLSLFFNSVVLPIHVRECNWLCLWDWFVGMKNMRPSTERSLLWTAKSRPKMCYTSRAGQDQEELKGGEKLLNMEEKKLVLSAGDHTSMCAAQFALLRLAWLMKKRFITSTMFFRARHDLLLFFCAVSILRVQTGAWVLFALMLDTVEINAWMNDYQA